MTLSDSRTMKLPPPVIKNSAAILISKKRLITVLGRLGLLGPDGGPKLISMIDDLWEEAVEYANLGSSGSGRTTNESVTRTTTPPPKWLGEETTSADGSVERDHNATEDDSHHSSTNDIVELGALKWILYGFPASQPAWFSRYCMPCGSSSQQQTPQPEHPSHGAGMKRQHGELVRHDILTCKLCRMAAGCPALEEETTVVDDHDYERAASSIQHMDSTANVSVDSAATRPDEIPVGEDDESFVDPISSVLPVDLPVQEAS